MRTHKLVVMAMLSSMSLDLMWLGFPLIPIAPYLKFEPGYVP